MFGRSLVALTPQTHSQTGVTLVSETPWEAAHTHGGGVSPLYPQDNGESPWKSRENFPEERGLEKEEHRLVFENRQHRTQISAAPLTTQQPWGPLEARTLVTSLSVSDDGAGQQRLLGGQREGCSSTKCTVAQGRLSALLVTAGPLTPHV